MATNQIYWQKADWAKLKLYAAAKALYLSSPSATPDPLADYPSGIVVDHLYFEDLRKIIWVLEHQHAGYYDDSAIEWNFSQVPTMTPANKDTVFKYAGLWEVSTYVEVHGVKRWVRWRNTRDLIYGEYHNLLDISVLRPPMNIHPANSQWNTSNYFWELAPSPNRYHDWDTNSRLRTHFNDVIYYAPNEIARDERYCAAADFYPKQTDPKEFLAPVIYNDTEQKDFQYKQKIAFNAGYITNPSALGAVFTAWGRYQWDIVANRTFQKRWGYGEYGGEWTGNQYANTGFETNSRNGDWTYNPKIGDALQNKIEMLLSNSGFRLPADLTYIANFKNFYNVTANDENVNWDDYPSVSSELWGENESGFEKFLKSRGTYDWYFDMSLPWIPSDFQRQAIEWEENSYVPITSEDECKLAWGCRSDSTNPLIGTWRRTWHNSLGRPNAFMRSFERGEPAHRKDTWNSAVTPPLFYYDSDDTWFGARTNQMPEIGDFDDRFETIIKASDYSFTYNGDFTSRLTGVRAGWMVHLCTSQNQTIDNVRPAYVLSSKYDSAANKTTIILSEKIDNYLLIGWCREISWRHDGFNAEWSMSNGIISYKIYYYPTVELMIEMKELLDLAIYKDVAVTITKAHLTLSASCDNPLIGSIAAAKANAIDNALDTSDIPGLDINDPDTWDSGMAEVRFYIVAGEIWYGPPDTGHFEYSANAYWYATAIKAEWGEALTSLPNNVMAKFRQLSILHGGAMQVVLSTEALGIVLSTILYDPPEVQKYYYHQATMPVNGLWYMLLPGDGLWDAPETIYDPTYQATTIFGAGDVGIYWNGLVSDTVLTLCLNWEDVPVSVWERDFIGHIDAPRTLEPDKEPPRPNPPVHKADPQAYFLLVQPDGAPAYFELRVKVYPCLCEDHEGSDPVWYQIDCAENSQLLSFSTTREADILIKQIPLLDPVTCEYTAASWAADAVKDYTFAIQTRDSAGDVQGTQDNWSKISDYVKIAEPTEYPQAILDAL